MGTKFKRRILSIDGGGIRGIIPAMVLNYIEERTGKRIATMFDFIAGTSTGGMLALGLTRKNSDSSINNEPEYTAAELVNFYGKYGEKIFNQNNLPGSWDDLLQPKHDPKGREEVLKHLLGEAKVEDALREIFIPSYDIELRAPIFLQATRMQRKPKVFIVANYVADSKCGRQQWQLLLHRHSFHPTNSKRHILPMRDITL
jgi:patatin-like phospholipase/acyl hydrolase